MSRRFVYRCPAQRRGVEEFGEAAVNDEGVCGGAEATIRRECDGLELDVEVLVADDLVGGLVLGVGVDVGGGTTCSLTRRVVDVSVDGGVCDADVQDRFALGE